MILNKINSLFDILSKLGKKERTTIGITYPVEIPMIKSALKMGKWPILFYEANPKKIATYGLRVIPNIEGTEWPSVSNMPYMETTTDFSNLTSKLIGGKIRVLKCKWIREKRIQFEDLITCKIRYNKETLLPNLGPILKNLYPFMSVWASLFLTLFSL